MDDIFYGAEVLVLRLDGYFGLGDQTLECALTRLVASPERFVCKKYNGVLEVCIEVTNEMFRTRYGYKMLTKK